MGNRVLGIPVVGPGGNEARMAFLIGHELTDALVAYSGGIPFAAPCTQPLLTPWINDGFADNVGAQIASGVDPLYPFLVRMGYVSALNYDRTSHMPVTLAATPRSEWQQFWGTPIIGLEYDVADEMVRTVLAQGGMALLRRVVRADGAHGSLTPILGQTPDQLATRSWAAYGRWYASQRLPAAYVDPRLWVVEGGHVRWAAAVAAYGLQPGRTPAVRVNGAAFTGRVPAASAAGTLTLLLAAGTRAVTVDGVRAQPASASLARQLMQRSR